jgi:hypothetical protein
MAMIRSILMGESMRRMSSSSTSNFDIQHTLQAAEEAKTQVGSYFIQIILA